MASPESPERERCDELLLVLGDLIARSGVAPLLAPPVTPGPEAFPEPWQATRGGAVALLRRLAWHANNPRAVVVVDERLGAPPTERKPETRVGLMRVTPKELAFRIEFLGDDDVAGTLAHELGVAHAALHRRDAVDPYRDAEHPEVEIDVDRDHERGSIAAVYLGLGVLAINASFQEYSRSGRWNGAYNPLEYDVLRAGYLPMSELAFLLAVQAVVRDAPLPEGLSGPQRDEVSTWIDALEPRAEELRTRLGIAADATITTTRPSVVAFTDIDIADDAPPPKKTAFRWRTHRGGVGFLAGIAMGAGVAFGLASPQLTLWFVFGGAGAGHVIGRSIRVPRCSGCASVVGATAATCTHCGANLRGDIAQLADRLEAEEMLEQPDRPRSASAPGSDASPPSDA